MRRVISFVVASTLLGAGLMFLYFDLTSAIGFQGKLALMGGFLIAVGGGWLWADFGGPWRAAAVSPRAKYRGEVLERVGTLMMRDNTSFPGLDEVMDDAFGEQWPVGETAVLYAGNLFEREIEALPNAERERVAEHVREWLSQPNGAQFDALMLRAKALLGEPGADYSQFLQWRVQWALDYVRRMRVTNDIDQGTQDWFVSKVCDPLWKEPST